MDWSAGPEEARAIAAIAFHMFLDLVDVVRGGEQEYALVRNVILGRVSPWKIVGICAPDGPQPYQFRDELPNRAKHLFLCGADRNGRLVCHLRLFAHETQPAPWWEVVLRDGVAPTSHKMFVALTYYEQGPRRVNGREYDGQVLALSGTKAELVLRADAMPVERLHPT
jgi:hypothetical protein